VLQLLQLLRKRRDSLAAELVEHIHDLDHKLAFPALDLRLRGYEIARAALGAQPDAAAAAPKPIALTTSIVARPHRRSARCAPAAVVAAHTPKYAPGGGVSEDKSLPTLDCAVVCWGSWAVGSQRHSFFRWELAPILLCLVLHTFRLSQEFAAAADSAVSLLVAGSSRSDLDEQRFCRYRTAGPGGGPLR
jgi:hypothetical protein